METKRLIDAEDWSSPLERILASFRPLTTAQLALVRAALGALHVHPADKLEAREAQVVVSGWAATSVYLEDGRRQIVSLFLPGDVIHPAIDLRTGIRADALTPLRTLNAGELAKAMAATPAPAGRPIWEAWAETRAAAQARVMRHVVRLGRLSAYERTADLLIELHERLRRAGVADERSMPMPLTQEMLADHLGLSVVHMNRTLQQLRRDELIAQRSGRIVFPRPEDLATAVRRAEIS